MARIFIEGFECGSGIPPGWGTSGATPAYSYVDAATYQMSGTYAFKLGISNTTYSRSLNDLSEFYGSLKVYPAVASPTIVFVKGPLGGMGLIGLYNSRFIFKPNTAYDPVAYSNSVFQTEVTYLIEFYLKLSPTVGRLILKVNGATEIDFTGDTAIGSSNEVTASQFCIGYVSGLWYGVNNIYDDIVADDADWIGTTYIQALTVSGASADGAGHTEWTPSVGDNYECVNEIPYNDTDYVSTNATGNVDTYTFTDATGDILSINAVRIISRSKYQGSPEPTTQKHVVRLGGVDYSGEVISPPLSFGYVESLLEVNPADSAAWEESDVNAMEVGFIAE
jgi:hypothetical protein